MVPTAMIEPEVLGGGSVVPRHRCGRYGAVGRCARGAGGAPGPRVQVSLPVSSLLEGEQFRTKDREHHLGNPILGGIEVFGCCNNSFLPR